jgi:hypothetical protein
MHNKAFLKARWIFILSIILFACQEKKNEPKTSFDTGRLFIESCLKGDFTKAKEVLFQDDQNLKYFEIFQKQYEGFSTAEKQAYKNSDYIIQEIKEPNDTVCLIRYENNYKKVPTNLKLIRKNHEWFVDFKYTFIEQDSIK